MALVEPLSVNANVKVQELAIFFNETLGFCPNSVLTMQIRPEIAKTFIELNKAVMTNKGKVTSDLKRLVAYVSSNATGCNYCQAHAILAAKRYGASKEKLENIWDYKTHPVFSEEERAALDFSIAASIIPNAVDTSIQKKMKKYYSDGEIVEILGVISLFGFLNRWNDSMGTTLESDAIEAGNTHLKNTSWKIGKHQ